MNENAAYLTDDEQLELIKEWVSKHGLKVVISLVLAFCIMLGWNWWQQRTQAYAVTSAQLFHQLMTSSDHAQQLALATQLQGRDSASVYGNAAVLYLAKDLVAQGDFTAAAKLYRKVYLHAQQWPELKYASFANYLRMLTAAGNTTQALQELRANMPTGNSLAITFYDLEGDLLVKSGQKNEAIGAYSKALQLVAELDSASVESVYVKWLELKRNNLLSAQ